MLKREIIATIVETEERLHAELQEASDISQKVQEEHPDDAVWIQAVKELETLARAEWASVYRLKKAIIG